MTSTVYTLLVLQLTLAHISHPFHSLYPSTVLLSYRLFSITFHTDQTLDKSLRSSTVYSVYSLRFLILQVFFQFKCSLTVFSGSQFKIILFTVYYRFKFSHNLCAVKVLNTPRAGLKPLPADISPLQVPGDVQLQRVTYLDTNSAITTRLSPNLRSAKVQILHWKRKIHAEEMVSLI